ncbi:WD40 repeat domain-containing protein [Aspergillus candidus]|uniref:WD40 repeat-like protein n=1 Tax=Aspergillus candidus TaxID=41067 RepID=A0A2I2F578_ASPCN|nr:WD40 repeat-like protein [Aspergillus candidus]PLB35738.1 WD40 repeat-like protein [Aspergillus candidus]
MTGAPRARPPSPRSSPPSLSRLPRWTILPPVRLARIRDSCAPPSPSLSDTKRASRLLQSSSQNAAVGASRNSLSSPTLFESADSSAIDPLSQHIIKRTNTQKSIPFKLLGRASHEAEAGGADHASLVDQGSARADAVSQHKPTKEKKKGVSFLSRIIPGKKKDQFLDEDDVSEPDTARMDADASAQPIGFFPRFPRPPKYLRVRVHYKKHKTFGRVFVAQELEGAGITPVSQEESEEPSAHGHGGAGKAIWALVFSNDGKYLAAAGQDSKVRVWSVVGSPEDRDSIQTMEDDGDGLPRLNAPVFRSEPIQVYEGHTGSVLDLSWSKNNFLLSSSMDKTVRLWHVTRPECLCCFKHSDFVTSIQFHPRDDRFFLAGSLDSRLRLWSIPDKSVAFMASVPDMITSVAFTPEGQYAIAGCLNGMCNIYQTDGLKMAGQIHVRSARGRNAKGSKITGIDTMRFPRDDPDGDVKLLITSNDSRIRLYNFRDRALEAKYRGNENTCSQIRASFSDDGKHIICGSEDRRTYLWPTGPVEKDADKRAVEVLDPQSAMVTAAVLAPATTKRILGASEDPIYDVCNPPPVNLNAHAPENVAQHRRSGSNRVAPESPTYANRSRHPDGNIIVIADYSGKIKVLRQDCAYDKRRFENWDTHSTLSRRILRRSNSARRSIASSIGKESSHKTPSERIISWRNSVIGHARNSGRDSISSRQGPRTRSPSPHRHHLSRYSSPRGWDSIGASQSTASPPPSAYKFSLDSSRRSSAEANATAAAAARRRGTLNGTPEERVAWAAAHVQDKDNPLWLQGDHSYAYYGKIAQDALAAATARPSQATTAAGDPNHLAVPQRMPSSGSALSSDYTSSAEGEGDGATTGDEGDVMRCENCRGTNFRATKARNGKQRLICVRCHRPIS